MYWASMQQKTLRQMGVHPHEPERCGKRDEFIGRYADLLPPPISARTGNGNPLLPVWKSQSPQAGLDESSCALKTDTHFLAQPLQQLRAAKHPVTRRLSLKLDVVAAQDFFIGPVQRRMIGILRHQYAGQKQ